MDLERALELDISMPLAQLRRLDVHSDVLVLFWVARAEDLPIGSGVDKEKLAIKDAISAL